MSVIVRAITFSGALILLRLNEYVVVSFKGSGPCWYSCVRVCNSLCLYVVVLFCWSESLRVLVRRGTGYSWSELLHVLVLRGTNLGRSVSLQLNIRW